MTATYLFTRCNRQPVCRNINLIPPGRKMADGPGQSGLRQHTRGRVGRVVDLQRPQPHADKSASRTGWRCSQRTPGRAQLTIPRADQHRQLQSGAVRSDKPPPGSGKFYTPTVASGSRIVRALVNGNVFAFTSTIQSGDVFNIGSNQILNADPSIPASLQRPLFIGKNTLRDQTEPKVRHLGVFPIRESLRLEFIAGLTNILNRTNLVGLNSTAQASPTGVVLNAPPKAWTAALNQRLVQLGSCKPYQ